MAGDEVKAQLRRAVERRPMNPAVRGRLCLLSVAKSRRLNHDAGTWPGAKHGQTSDSAAARPQERGMVCVRPVKAGAHILADVHVAYATDAFESLHVQCSNKQEVRAHKNTSRRPTHAWRETPATKPWTQRPLGAPWRDPCQPLVKVPIHVQFLAVHFLAVSTSRCNF